VAFLLHPAVWYASHHLSFRFHPDGRPYEGKDWPLARSLLHGEVVTDEDTMYERGDGTRGIVRLSSAPVRNCEGEIIAALVVCEDVTGASCPVHADARAWCDSAEVLTVGADGPMLRGRAVSVKLAPVGAFVVASPRRALISTPSWTLCAHQVLIHAS
jgi:hypothetical protein